MQISYEVGGRGRGEGRRRVRRREIPSRYVSERGKTARAYQAYVDLMQTAEWIRELAGKHLVAFNMSMVEYRLMEWIYRHGPQYQMELSRRFQCSKQNVAWLIGRLAGFGWLKRATGRLPAKRAVAGGWPSSAKAPEGGPSSAKAADDQRASGSKKKGVRVRVKPAGRPVIRVFLTEQGRAVIAEAMRKHAKYVKAEMRALDGREQQTLSRLCRKLQEGDPLRFFREIKRFDWDDEEQDRRVGLTGLAVRLDKALKRVEQAKSAGIAGGGARALPAPAGVQRPQITMQIRRPDGSFPRP
jgi:DNA-binding MarR family transcriptional regulator